MHQRFKNIVLRTLRVPPEPRVPAGSPGSARTFRAAPNFYRLKLLGWALGQAGGLAIIIVFFIVWHTGLAQSAPENIRWWVDLAKVGGVTAFLIQVPFTLAMVRLDYEMRWYIVTDRSLRIRAGLVNVREMTMTFANIQHISVHQGPLQRLLGIYDLEVSTAGGGTPASAGHGRASGGQQMMHRGFFRGIDNAPQVRDLMQERLRRLRDAGLGDPDEAQELTLSSTLSRATLLEAARELLREGEALRRLTA